MQVEEPNTEYLGRAIASLRTARGMKRMDLKQASGLSYPYIAEIENGSKKSPSLKAVAQIAAALGVSSAELQARAEDLKSADSERNNAAFEVGPPDFSVTGASRSGRVSAGQTGKPEDELTERIAARVLEAVGPQIGDLVAREVRYAVREELLQQREVR
jgi:transcriptional regulator with XRE-family HTH domain